MRQNRGKTPLHFSSLFGGGGYLDFLLSSHSLQPKRIFLGGFNLEHYRTPILLCAKADASYPLFPMIPFRPRRGKGETPISLSLSNRSHASSSSMMWENMEGWKKREYLDGKTTLRNPKMAFSSSVKLSRTKSAFIVPLLL